MQADLRSRDYIRQHKSTLLNLVRDVTPQTQLLQITSVFSN